MENSLDQQDSRSIRTEIDYASYLDAQWLASITRHVSPEWLEAQKNGYGTHFSPSNLQS
jgi:hypothetical protein